MDGCAQGLTFGETHFGAARLGDQRRSRRLVASADRIIGHPGGTLPEKLGGAAPLKGLYRLMNTDEVTHEAVLEPSRRQTLARVSRTSGTVLFIHDTSELDFTGRKSLTNLGRLGNGGGRGYLCHNTLAVLPGTREVLGLAYQFLARRPQVKHKETRAQRRDKPDRESRLWKQASQTLPLLSEEQRFVEVADRGADLLEFLDQVEASGRSYLVRSKHNRCIEQEDAAHTKLHTFARKLPAQGHKTIHVPAASQRPKRSACMSIAWSKVTLLMPKQARGHYRGVPLSTWVLCIREIDPPPGVKPLEWILLTNVPVETLADAHERIAWYECRWVIEEYHKVLKTGCGVEQLQFTSEEALKPAIALLSVMGLFLLALRDASRQSDAASRPATDVMPEEYVVALSLWRYRQPRTDLSVHEFLYALARLGGHQNRKHDHPPGWIVLWRGWTKLHSMVEALSAIGYQKCG